MFMEVSSETKRFRQVKVLVVEIHVLNRQKKK